MHMMKTITRATPAKIHVGHAGHVGHVGIRSLLATASLTAAVLLACGNSAAAAVVAGPAEAQPSSIVQNAIGAFSSAHPGTRVNVRAGAITRVYGNTFSTGATPIDSADAFVNANAGIFGVSAADLLPVGPFPDGARVLPLVHDAATNSDKFTLVTYSQHLNGIPVFRADLRVLVRNETDFPAVLATTTLKDLGAFGANFNDAPVAPTSIDQKKMLRIVRNQFRTQPTITNTEMVIWAGVDDQPEPPRTAIKFIAEGGLLRDPDNYQKFLYVVDAQNGRILYQENQVCFMDVSGTVNGLATQGSGADICGPEVAEGLPYSKITLGAVTVFADANGAWTATGVSPATQTAQSTIGGLYFVVADAVTSVSSLSAPLSGGPVNFVHSETNADALVRAQVNAYLQANVIRDLVIAQNPNYPVISGQSGANAFTINTNIAATCNAFYNGPSINFYQAGGNCQNTAFSTVVHHEFGHHVVASGGSGQGAYGEGMGDAMGILVTDESITGIGFQNCSGGIRDANNSCQFSAGSCSTCGSEIHACGQLISGCIWDLRTNWLAEYPADYRERLASIVINSVPLHGSISTIAADIVVDYLTLDDDNGNINDGTPNYASIADAFGQHGLPAPPLQLLTFDFPNGIPTTVSPNGTTLLNVNVNALLGTPEANTGKFFWRNGNNGAFASIDMTQTAANAYQVAIPSTVCLSTLQFYVQAGTTTNTTVTSPANAPNGFYTSVSATSTTAVFSDSLETEVAGWQVGTPSDTATTGQWVRVDPNGTAAQPGDDHTADGTMCYVTGQGSPGGALGEADIDGGQTTLLSPKFSAIDTDVTFVSYWRWYSNDTGSSPNSDAMPVDISNNGGVTWFLLENVTENANAWVFKSFKVSDFVTPTANMRLRWRASDFGPGSLVEAGVDDVFVTGYSCAASVLGDLNDDGTVDAADLAILLGAWGTDNAAADLDGDGTVNGADLAILLGSFGP